MPRPASDEHVPAGAAVLPLVAAELNVHPLLLAALHAIVFLQGSDEKTVAPAAAQEQLELIASCLQRLQGPELQRVREDMSVLAGYAKDQGWPKGAQEFFSTFLNEFGVGRTQMR